MTNPSDHQPASRREKGSSILRVLDILHHVCTAEKATPLPELIAELDIPKATAHRLVQQLEEQRFFQTNMRGNLVPGPAMRAIAMGVMNSNELKALNFSMTLQDRCLTLADALADEINGELGLVPDEDVERILAGLTESNLNETAEELAQLAAWFN